MIPWRIKKIISDKFPLIYHKIINYGIMVNSNEYWDEIYRREWDSAKRIWPTKNQLVKDKTRETDHILDIACGTGSILRYLKSNGYENLYGTEISDLCIERLQNLGISMFKSFLPEIEYEDNSFEVVIASQILEHIIQRDKFLGEMKRILKQGGQGFIFVPDNCLGPIDEPSHVIKFTHKSLTKLIRKHFNSFTVISMKDENFEMPILFAHIKN